MRVLFVGDSPVGGAANYLLGILKSMKVRLTHLPPGVAISKREMKKPYDVALISDYPSHQFSRDCQKRLHEQSLKGTGVAMIGGWASFAGPFGKWKGSIVESLLPVQCLPRDDRRNLSGGAAMITKKKHAILSGISLQRTPVICGLNEIRAKKDAFVLMTARAILQKGAKLKVQKKEYPLLVVREEGQSRSAAFACDFAPHWCGGLVDWGKKRVKLKVTKHAGVEVGNDYVKFVKNFVNWLADH